MLACLPACLLLARVKGTSVKNALHVGEHHTRNLICHRIGTPRFGGCLPHPIATDVHPMKQFVGALVPWSVAGDLMYHMSRMAAFQGLGLEHFESASPEKIREEECSNILKSTPLSPTLGGSLSWL